LAFTSIIAARLLPCWTPSTGPRPTCTRRRACWSGNGSCAAWKSMRGGTRPG